MPTPRKTLDLPLLRTSERGQFKRCPQRWIWGNVEGLGVAGPPDVKLWFGGGWHEVLAHWYCGPGLRRGKNPLRVWRDWIGDEMIKIRVNLHGEDWKEEVYIEAGELGEIMLGHYLDTYGRDETWHIIQPERVSQVIIPDRAGKPLVKYSFTYDLVYRDLTDESVWLGEHKTAKAIATNHLPLDDQAGSYWAVATTELRHDGKIGRNESLKGIMYNFAKKSPPDERPLNEKGLATNKPSKQDYIDALIDANHLVPEKPTLGDVEGLCDVFKIDVFGPVSKNQPKPTLVRFPVYRSRQERNAQIERIQNEAAVMAKYRSGELLPIKNPTKDCSWDCQFHQLCLIHERGGDWQEYRDALYVKTDPYLPYRKTSAIDE